MITRGHLIGKIVDGLTSISQQVSTRCQLGLTDLNRYPEDLFKDYLNEALALSLVNLNDERSNEPGLDLGDEVPSVAFQVTSTKTAQKVNKTLKTTSKNQFDEINVLVIGKKQTSYQLGQSLIQSLAFTEENIWDIGDLCKKTISPSA
ncbi:SMEK domain-containing protein [Halomonas sp. E14]|uniref:SMEK domain-containing protein n=1 Tax=Halomonas sp. E14 TaxID=3397245 RepID=UPI00403EC273